MEYLWVVWTTVIVAAVVAEVLIPGLVAIWFVPGGIVSLVLSLFSVVSSHTQRRMYHIATTLVQ